MSKQEFETRIELDQLDRLSLSEHEDGLWLSVWKVGAYVSTPMSRDKVIELRDALNQFLGE
jgi:hypothetical protein